MPFAIAYLSIGLSNEDKVIVECILAYFVEWCLHMPCSSSPSSITLNAQRQDLSVLLPASKQQWVLLFAFCGRSLGNCPANDCLLKLGWLGDFFCAIASKACQGEKRNTCNFQAWTKLTNSELNSNEKREEFTKEKAGHNHYYRPCSCSYPAQYQR